MNEVEFVKSWLQELDQSQWRSSSAIERSQRQALGKILTHAHRTVPFYRDRFKSVIGNKRFNWSRWGDIPIVTKDEVIEHREALTSNDVPPEHGTVTSATTSGSMGTPLTLCRARNVELRSHCIVHRCFQWHGFDMTARMAYIIPTWDDNARDPVVKRYGYWTPVARLLGVRGDLIVFGINTPVEKQIELLRHFSPKYVHTLPTNARALARRLDGKPVDGLEKLVLAGESLSDEDRAECEQGFGAVIIDRYGAMETGQIALQCPSGNHYHVQSENLLLEVVGPDGTVVEPGESGRVVATTLHNYAFPLIRYQLDDIVTLGRPCSCGRGLPVIEKILGRSRHMFRFPDGTEVWPSLGAGLAILSPRQWQVAQTGPLELEIRYVPADPSQPSDYNRMTAFIRRQFRQNLNVRYRRLVSLPTPPGGKFHDYINEL